MSAPAQLNQLLAKASQHLQLQQWDKAERVLRKALKQSPDNAEILQRLGGVQRRLGQPRKALETIDRALTVAPDNLVLETEYAEALMDLGRTGDALERLGRCIEAHPENTDLRVMRSRIRLGVGDLHGACEDCQIASDLRPDDLELLARLVDSIIARAYVPMETDAAQRLVEQQPFNAKNHARLATIHRLNNELEAATACYERSLELQPGNAEAISGMAEVLESSGDTDAAANLLTPHVHRTNAPFQVLTAWMRTQMRLERWDEAARTARAWLDASPRSPRQSAVVNHRIGNALDRAGRADEAFRAWARGNEPYSRTWNPDEHTRLTDSIIGTFSTERLAQLPRSTRTDRRPVFIMGMFRSGTTLLEQIISMHPAVHAAGERAEMLEIAGTLQSTTGSELTYPACIAETGPDILDACADDYLRGLTDGAGDAEVITDKLPLNYLNIGLISVILPGARIIHCNRDPLDTCLSCFGNSFSSRMSFTANLEHLAQAYLDYDRIMEHWRSVDIVPMHELDYESLARNPEHEIARVLEFLGLPWDDACMQFHRSTRIAQTLSRDQVRQPMYTRSIGRSRAYWDQLEPVRRRLGALVPDTRDQ